MFLGGSGDCLKLLRINSFTVSESDRLFCCSGDRELDMEIFVIILESPFIKYK